MEEDGDAGVKRILVRCLQSMIKECAENRVCAEGDVSSPYSNSARMEEIRLGDFVESSLRSKSTHACKGSTWTPRVLSCMAHGDIFCLAVGLVLQMTIIVLDTLKAGLSANIQADPSIQLVKNLRGDVFCHACHRKEGSKRRYQTPGKGCGMDSGCCCSSWSGGDQSPGPLETCLSFGCRTTTSCPHHERR